VQEVAFVELQVSVEAPPLTTDVGDALSDTVGAGATGAVGAATVTVAVANELVPPLPMQASEYVVLALRAPVLFEPLVAKIPDQPPIAVQDVAFVEFQESVEAPPLTTDVGIALSDTVGAGGMGVVLASTVTVAVPARLVPPAPLQVSVYEVLAVSAPVLWAPLVAFEPDQPPAAVQEVAFVELHMSIEAPPLTTDMGDALSNTVGAGVVTGVVTGVVVAATVTVAVAGALTPPDDPVQVSEYDALAVNAPVLWVPLAASGPVHAPEAVQAVALVELQMSVESPPLATDVGDAARDTVGTGSAPVTATLTESTSLVPPAPVHVNEYVVAAVSEPVLCVPLVACTPVQPPEAVQAVALSEVQLRVDEPPLSTVVGDAVIDAVVTGVTGSLPIPPQAASASVAPAINKTLKHFKRRIPFCQSVKQFRSTLDATMRVPWRSESYHQARPTLTARRKFATFFYRLQSRIGTRLRDYDALYTSSGKMSYGPPLMEMARRLWKMTEDQTGGILGSLNGHGSAVGRSGATGHGSRASVRGQGSASPGVQRPAPRGHA
jgi:hypothetical protein